MAGRLDNFERWSAQTTLLVGDATKTLLPAKSGRIAVCTHILANCLVSAAQSVVIACGTMTLMSLAASEGVAAEHFWGPADYGLPGSAVNTAIIITPSAAGSSWHVKAEGYYV